jgi:hypothetical protein
MRLDLAARPDVKYLRARWDVNRWIRAAGKPLFTVYLLVRSGDLELACAGA